MQLLCERLHQQKIIRPGLTFLKTLKKIVQLRTTKLNERDLSVLNPNRLKLLARIGRRATNQALQRMPEERRYPVYAHLQPGSLRVKLGDKVRRGQTLGLVGNSGNSTEPHLHFHITDANSPLGSEGLP